MILNHATDMVYVGSTKASLADRWRAHLSSAKKGSQARIHAAIRAHGEECFEVIPLESNLDTVDDLERYEKFWIEQLSALEPNVGYNVRGEVTKRSEQPDLTEEQREQFREWGRRGAKKSKENIVARARAAPSGRA